MNNTQQGSIDKSSHSVQSVKEQFENKDKSTWETVTDTVYNTFNQAVDSLSTGYEKFKLNQNIDSSHISVAKAQSQLEGSNATSGMPSSFNNIAPGNLLTQAKDTIFNTFSSSGVSDSGLSKSEEEDVQQISNQGFVDKSHINVKSRISEMERKY
ncbi:hypothetical protein ABK040_013075 [Willaertia magna]